MTKFASLRRRQPTPSVLSWPRRIRPMIALAALLALLPMATIALFQLAADAPSPATGHAQVIAHGVSALPAQQLAWRVVEDTAEPPAQSTAEERALGFALADQQAIVVYDQTLGGQARLAAGEASFVPSGAVQQRSSLAGLPATYYRLALVPAAQANDAGGDRLIFGSEAWTAPAGDQFDLDLIRDVVAPNESSAIPATNGPTLVLATSGTIEIEANGDEPVRLETGAAEMFTGELSIFGIGSEPATFVAAALGPEVPPPPAPPTGSITVNVLGCPAGVSAAEAVAANFAADVVGNCTPTALPADPLLILAGDQPLPPDQPAPDQGAYTWNFLLYSPFPVADFELPAGFDSYLLVNASGIVKANDASGVTPTVPDPDVLFVGAEVPDAVATLFLFAEDDGGGSISLAPFTCPEGMTADNFDSSFCEPAPDPNGITVTAIATGETKSIADAESTSGGMFYTWSGLAPGDYLIDVPTLPAGYATFGIPGLDPDPGSGAYQVRLTEAVPDAQFNLFFLQEGDARGGGTLTVSVFNCPPGMTRSNLVTSACQPAAGFDLNLYPPTGGALGLSDASVQGNAVTWSNLSFAEYAVEEVILPSGYADAFAPGVPTSSLSDRVYVAPLTEASPVATIAIYNLQAVATTPGQTPDVDDDADDSDD